MIRKRYLGSACGLLLLSLLAGTAIVSSRELPNPSSAGFAEKLYRLDCGRSIANDELIWTPGENQGHSIEFSSTCWLVKRGNQCLLWDTGVPEATANDPNGWSNSAQADPLSPGQDINGSACGDRSQAARRHLRCHFTHPRGPHWQCHPVSRCRDSDTANRIRMDTWRQWAKRKR